VGKRAKPSRAIRMLIRCVIPVRLRFSLRLGNRALIAYGERDDHAGVLASGSAAECGRGMRSRLARPNPPASGDA